MASASGAPYLLTSDRCFTDKSQVDALQFWLLVFGRQAPCGADAPVPPIARVMQARAPRRAPAGPGAAVRAGHAGAWRSSHYLALVSPTCGSRRRPPCATCLVSAAVPGRLIAIIAWLSKRQGRPTAAVPTPECQRIELAGGQALQRSLRWQHVRSRLLQHSRRGSHQPRGALAATGPTLN